MTKRELVGDVSVIKECRDQYRLTLICREVIGSSSHGRTGNGYAEPEKAKECEELHLRELIPKRLKWVFYFWEASK